VTPVRCALDQLPRFVMGFVRLAMAYS